MLLVKCPQFSVLVLEEAGLIAILNHGFHESHAEGHILIANAFNIEFELFLNAVQFYLQLPYQVFEGTCLDLPSSTLLDLALHLGLVVLPNSVVLIRKIPYLRTENVYLIVVDLYHFPQVVFILLRCLYLQELIFSEQALHLFLQSPPHEQRLLEALNLTIPLQLTHRQFFYQVFSVVKRHLQGFNLLPKGLVLSSVAALYACQALSDEIFCFLPLILTSLGGLLLQFKELIFELRCHFLTQIVDLSIVGILQLAYQQIFSCVPFQLLLLKLIGELLDDLSTVLFLPYHFFSLFLLQFSHVLHHFSLELLEGEPLIAFLFFLDPHHILHELNILQLHLIIAGIEIRDDDLQSFGLFSIGLSD